MAVDRRGFLKFVIGGAAGTLLTPIPWTLTDDLSIWSQNWPWIPRNISGADAYKATVSKLCPSGVGVLVRTVGGQPVRALGNPDHPLSQGKITALAAAEVQMMYSEARLREPMLRKSDGGYVEITWDEAQAILEEKLGNLAGKLALVSGDETGTVNEVLSAFTAKTGSALFFQMPGEAQVARRTWLDVMGGTGQVGYDVENSDYVLAIGADILESWGAVVNTRRAYAASHPHGEEPSAKYVYAGPVATNTAAGADQWLPTQPGGQAALALGLCNLLLQAGASAEANDFAEFRSFVSANYSPAQVQKLTGVSPDDLQALAKELMAASRPVVIVGSEFAEGTGVAPVLAGFALNMLLGRLNARGGMRILPEAPTVVSGAMDAKTVARNNLVSFLRDVAQDKTAAPEALVVYDANPVYALPDVSVTQKAMEQIPFKVSISPFMDETAALSDLVLPMPMGMERYDDVYSPYGVNKAMYSVATPVIEPLTNARHGGDVVLALASKLGMDLGFGSMEDVIQAKADALGAKARKLENGEAWTSDETVGQSGLYLNASLLSRAMGAKAGAGLALAPVFKLNFGTAKTSTPAFNLKTIRPHELLGNESFVQMNKATAQQQGVGQGDMVTVTSPAGSIKARVNIWEGVMDGVVAAYMGLGHTAFDEFTEGKGANVSQVLAVSTEPGTGLPVWENTRVQIAKS
jgi:anaerobic selenocysteine-containing dehydrogenase